MLFRSGRIAPEEYAENVRRIERFLSGQHREFVDELTGEMQEAAAELDFERAARIKARIDTINGLADKQHAVSTRNLDADVVAGLAEAGVSLDYVLGLTDTQPEGDTDSDAPWHYGDPVEDGYYWCLCGPLDGSGKLLYWSGDHWEFSNIVMAINTNVVCWMHCPPIPEAQSWHRQQIED